MEVLGLENTSSFLGKIVEWNEGARKPVTSGYFHDAVSFDHRLPSPFSEVSYRKRYRLALSQGELPAGTLMIYSKTDYTLLKKPGIVETVNFSINLYRVEKTSRAKSEKRGY